MTLLADIRQIEHLAAFFIVVVDTCIKQKTYNHKYLVIQNGSKKRKVHKETKSGNTR